MDIYLALFTKLIEVHKLLNTNMNMFLIYPTNLKPITTPLSWT